MKMLQAAVRKSLSFAAIVIALFAFAAVASADVRTDKQDYAPGETVYITGDGMLAGERVQVDVYHPDGSLAQRHEVVASSTGTFSDTYVLPSSPPVFGTYTVRATGLTSGRVYTSTFTDGNVRVRSNASGISFTLTWTTYNTTDCSGPASGSGTESSVGFSGGDRFTKGVGNTESIKLEASATSNQGGPFQNWSAANGTDPFTVIGGGGRIICVPGFPGGGTREYVASYGAPNTPPTVAASSPSVTVNEGQTATNSGTYSDPNASQNVTITASVGTVTKMGTNSGTWSWSFATTDGPAQSQTVTITANDGAGGTASTTFSLTVNNVPPTASFSNGGAVNEGSAGSVSFSGQFDPSSVDTSAGFLYSYDFDNDGTFEVTDSSVASATVPASYLVDGPGNRTVRGRIKDKDGGFTDYTTTITINNVAPTIVLTGAGSVDEGSPYTLSLGAVTDPGADTVTGYSIDWGDGTMESFTGSPVGVNKMHTYADGPNSYTIKVSLTDEDGTFSPDTTPAGGGSKAITVTNVAPTVTYTAAPTSADEGQAKTYSFTVSDPGADTYGVTSGFPDCGAGGSLVGGSFSISGNSGTQTGSFQCAFLDGPATTAVQIRFTDSDGAASNIAAVTVTVNNVAPTVDTPAVSPTTTNEGTSTSFTVSASFSDPAGSADAPYTCVVHWGDGTSSSGAVSAFTCSFTSSHTYADNGVYNVTVSVTDNDGGTGTSGAAQVTVNNVAPTVTAPADQTADEGTVTAFGLGSFSDPGVNDGPWSVSVDWGDGSVPTTFTVSGQGSLGSQSHTYADNGTYTVSVTVRDKDGGSGLASFQVTVNNVAPTVTIVSASPSSINEGQSVTLTWRCTDPGADSWTAFISWGDGSPVQALGPVTCNGANIVTMHTYADDNPTGTASDVNTIMVSVTDDDGGSGSAPTTVTVNNVAPDVPSNPGLTVTPTSIAEGGSVTLSGTFTDPGVMDTHAVTIDWGDGSTTNLSLAGALSFSATHQYLDDNPSGTPSDGYTITVTVTDDDTGTKSATALVTVNNVAPVINNISATPTGPVPVGTSTTVTATFSDVGTQDTHTCTVSWDDGSSSPGTVVESSGSGTCTASKTYTAAGVYTVTVTVTDDDGGSVSGVYEYIVVYDPNAGFVTGGGWINSLAGAYRRDPTLTGRANFGFVSKYQKGATTPTGQTEFQFKAGDLNFHSTSYQWLVVSGCKAQYKGYGTINGSGNYGFLLTAYDAQAGSGGSCGGSSADRFRIKIWDAATNTVVYDNRFGTSDDIDAANPQEIAGGSIVVHRK